MSGVRAGLKAMALLLLCLLLTVLIAFVQEARSTVHELHVTIADGHRRLNPILTHADTVMGRAQITMGKLELASRQQEVVAQKTLLLLDKTAVLLSSANETVQGINGDAAEIRLAAIGSLGQLNETSRTATQTLEETTGAARTAQETLQQATTTLRDFATAAPALRRSLENTTLLTSNAVQTSADVRDYVHRATRPVSLLHRAGRSAIQLGVKVLSYVIF